MTSTKPNLETLKSEVEALLAADSSKPEERIGTFKFEMSCGRMVRRDVVRKIRSICHRLNLKLYIQEDKGFLDSSFYVTGTGSESAVREFARWFELFLDANGDD